MYCCVGARPLESRVACPDRARCNVIMSTTNQGGASDVRDRERTRIVYCYNMGGYRRPCRCIRVPQALRPYFRRMVICPPLHSFPVCVARSCCNCLQRIGIHDDAAVLSAGLSFMNAQYHGSPITRQGPGDNLPHNLRSRRLLGYSANEELRLQSRRITQRSEFESVSLYSWTEIEEKQVSGCGD
ncbi:hypothetical protein SCHPADRAFT_478726 [Schizopora paradoxa]|uniref:Uncharacterized protein n=1 Tax=Schizopora paradoxa TaxID=27342 RepID=A0A0H2RP72_9AGAM|nr:hypothetical protein SCHPADRAFT_478726 [Schizopora paradoxa]